MNQRRLLILSIVGTGITSVTTQLVTIREFLTQFHGNEITISLSLFCWLLLTAMGSLAAKRVRRISLNTYGLLVLVIASWPLMQLIGIRQLREIFFAHGVSPGFYPVFFYIFLTIAPYCFLTGFILPCAQKVLNAGHTDFTSGDLYLTDSIGDITGGALFSLVLVYWVKPFVTLAVTSTLLILTGLVLLSRSRSRALLFAGLILATLFYIPALNSRFETGTLAGQYGHIEQYAESPFGRIVITKEASQYTLWESGTPLYSGSNVISSEEKIHYALSQLDRVQDVLLLSGGLGQTITEVEKYHPSRIDYVELDPALTTAAEKIGLIRSAPGLRIINTDGRSYVRTAREKYDAIIMDLPEPGTFQVNRFFTREFFALAGKILKPGGVLSISISYSPNYFSGIWKKKASSLYATLRHQFRHVLVLPGEKAYFLCRNGRLFTDIPSRLKVKSIRTTYVQGFFYGNVTAERIREIRNCLDPRAPVNSDFHPRLINRVFQQWFWEYGTSPDYFLLVLLAVVLAYLIFIQRKEYVLFATGMAGMGIEMLIIFAFQAVYGYIYLKIGAIVTAFLLGLLPGAAIGNIRRGNDRTQLIVSEVLLLGLLLLFYIWAIRFRTPLSPACYLIYGFLFSLVCGFQFPVITRMIGEHNSPAAGCLAADLAGASIGTFVTGTLLIPLLGIQPAIVFLMVIKGLSLGTVVLFKKGAVVK